jgi:hypothetical protein
MTPLAGEERAELSREAVELVYRILERVETRERAAVVLHELRQLAESAGEPT